MQVSGMRLFDILARMWTDSRGTSTVEYGFLLLLIVIGLIYAVDGLGGENGGMWADNMEKISTAMKQ